MRRTGNDRRIICPSILALLLAVACAFPCATGAEATESGVSQPPLQHRVESPDSLFGGRWTGYADLAGSWDPRGIGITGGADYRRSYRYSEQYKTVSAYWQTGLGLGVNPAYVQPSINLEWMPWLPLLLHASCDGYYFYGINGGLLSFSSPHDAFGDPVRRAREGTEESGFGGRLMFQPTLRIKLGGFILRNQTDYAYYRFPGTGPFFLELEYDTLLKDKDHLFANRTQALAEFGTGGEANTLLGPFYEVVHAEAAHLARKRAGLLAYTEQGPQLAFFRKTRYFALAGYNLEDPNRRHELFVAVGIGGTFGL